jgi:hypothetical protein
MSGYQLLVTLFGLISLAASIWAIWCVARSKIRYKAAWIIGSLLGFVGLGLNWTKPEDLILLVGVQIPPVVVFEVLATQFVIVKAQFPLVAVVALAKSQFGEAGRQPDS